MSFKTAFFSFLEREMSPTDLEACARGGAQLADLDEAIALEIEALRPADAEDTWEPASHQRQAMALAWCARALTTIVDRMLTADEGHQGSGYLSVVTYVQVRELYVQVPRLVGQAWEALANPSFRADRSLPLALGPRVPAEGTCPVSHLRGMKAAADELAALLDAREAEGDAIAQRRARAASAHTLATRSLDALDTGGGALDAHDEAESRIWAALSQQYRLGQLLAMPALLEGAGMAGEDAEGRTIAPEDRWYLTNPEAREDLEGSEFGEQMINAFWSVKGWQTTAIEERYLSQCAALLEANAIHVVSRWPSCPFDPVYQADELVSVLDTLVEPGRDFHLDMDIGEDVLLVGAPRIRSARATE